MKSIIEKGPSITEAFDMNTGQAHAYFGEVKQWISSQNEDLSGLDLAARKAVREDNCRFKERCLPDANKSRVQGNRTNAKKGRASAWREFFEDKDCLYKFLS